MSLRRQTIARRLLEAQSSAAMLTTFNEVDMQAVMALSARRKEGFKAKYGVSLGLSSFFVKAVIGALKAFPLLNAEIQGNEIVVKRYYDIGIAVGAAEGLVVPVLREADRLSIRVIARAAKDLAARARARKLKLEEMQGGVFSVSNLGMFKIDRFAAVINPPESMILAVGAVRDVPVVKGGQVVPGKRCAVTLSCDHRVVDGALGAKFLLALREIIEKPLRVIV